MSALSRADGRDFRDRAVRPRERVRAQPLTTLLVWRYRSDTDPAPVDAIVSDLHTQEFVALRAAVIAEHQRRTGDLQPRTGDLRLAAA